jgi:hypothetical protein
MVPTGGVRKLWFVAHSIHCTILQRKGFGPGLQDRYAQSMTAAVVSLVSLSIKPVLQPIEFNNQAEGGIAQVSMTE